MKIDETNPWPLPDDRIRNRRTHGHSRALRHQKPTKRTHDCSRATRTSEIDETNPIRFANGRRGEIGETNPTAAGRKIGGSEDRTDESDRDDSADREVRMTFPSRVPTHTRSGSISHRDGMQKSKKGCKIQAASLLRYRNEPASPAMTSRRLRGVAAPADAVVRLSPIRTPIDRPDNVDRERGGPRAGRRYGAGAAPSLEDLRSSICTRVIRHGRRNSERPARGRVRPSRR